MKQHDKLKTYLEEKTHLYPKKTYPVIQKSEPGFLEIQGKKYLNFASNDYLSFSFNKKILSSFANASQISTSSSFAVCGLSSLHEKLKEQILDFLGFEDLIFFSSGFSANQAVLNCLLDKNIFFIFDKLSHASISNITEKKNIVWQRFLHNNIFELEKKLAKKKQDLSFIATEGVFSMDGDEACLLELLELKKKYNSYLFVDDAHGLGVLGKQGQGKSNPNIDIYMANFNKALGISGAFVAGKKYIIDYMRQKSAEYIYTTAFSPLFVNATLSAFETLKKEKPHLELQEKIKLFKELAKIYLNWDIKTNSSIFAYKVESKEKAIFFSQQLFKKGIFVKAVFAPTAASPRLRITITNATTKNNIIFLLKNLATMQND